MIFSFWKFIKHFHSILSYFHSFINKSHSFSFQLTSYYPSFCPSVENSYPIFKPFTEFLNSMIIFSFILIISTHVLFLRTLKNIYFKVTFKAPFKNWSSIPPTWGANFLIWYAIHFFPQFVILNFLLKVVVCSLKHPYWIFSSFLLQGHTGSTRVRPFWR